VSASLVGLGVAAAAIWQGIHVHIQWVGLLDAARSADRRDA
jgi:hypothetical protein